MNIPDHIDFEEYLATIGLLESPEIHAAGHWREELLAVSKDGFRVVGDCLPWSKTYDTVRLREGELSLWAGINGHKKSMLLGFIMLELAKFRKVAIASLEMTPVQTLFRMACQYAGHRPNTGAMNQFLQWADENILVYDQLDKTPVIKILGFVYYCAKELGCHHIVIDSLTKCGIPQGDHVAEKEFIDRLQWAAKTLKVHIHLVCHVRKPSSAGEEHVPSKFDVRGAGELVDLCDNLFIVWKDKRVEDAKKRHAAHLELSKIQEALLEMPDQKLIVAKQRHGTDEPTINLWFHDSSMQFLGSSKPVPMVFTEAA